MDADAPSDGNPEPSTAAGRQALDGLRAIWAATGALAREGELYDPPAEPDADG